MYLNIWLKNNLCNSRNVWGSCMKIEITSLFYFYHFFAVVPSGESIDVMDNCLELLLILG